MSTSNLRSGLALGTLLSAVLLGGCVSRSDFDALKAQNDQLQQQVQSQQAELTADKAQISRLQGAIKYTVDSDLLFPSGGWQMSSQGKTIIARLASRLAPTQQNKLLVAGYTDNAPIGPALRRRGIASNEELSQKRAENVREFLISRGFNADLVAAQGFGEADPVAPNDTQKGRAKNRRVEISIAGSATPTS